MGVIGCLTIIRPMMMVWAFGLILPMFIAAILWVTGDVLGALGAFGETNIGNIAHLSGIGIGLILGLYLRNFIRKRKRANNKLEIPKYHLENWENKYIK